MSSNLRELSVSFSFASNVFRPSTLYIAHRTFWPPANELCSLSPNRGSTLALSKFWIRDNRLLIYSQHCVVTLCVEWG